MKKRELTAAEIGIVINEQSGKGRTHKHVAEFSEEETNPEIYEEYQRLSAADPKGNFDPKDQFIPVEKLTDVLIDEDEDEDGNVNESKNYVSRCSLEPAPAKEEMQNLCFYIVDCIPGAVSCFIAPGAAGCISGKISAMKTVRNRLAEQN